MSKVTSFNCTEESADRGKAFEFLSGQLSLLRSGRKQFTMAKTVSDDGSFSITIESNGLSVGQQPKANPNDESGQQSDNKPDVPSPSTKKQAGK